MWATVAAVFLLVMVILALYLKTVNDIQQEEKEECSEPQSPECHRFQGAGG